MGSVLRGSLTTLRSYNSAKPVKLRFELTNHGKVDLYVLKWFTPLEGLQSDCLNVRRNKKTKVPYDGKLIKRGPPTPENYVLVKAGQTVTADVELTDAYRVSVPAQYDVKLKIRNLQSLPAPAKSKKLSKSSLTAAVKSAKPRPQTIRGDGCSFKVAARTKQLTTAGEKARQKSQKRLAVAAAKKGVVASAAAAAPDDEPLPAAFNGGTASKKTIVRRAHGLGFRLSKQAFERVANNAKYKKWFGTYSTSRFAKVKRCYRRIVDRMRDVTFTYDLTGDGCEPGVYAYTYQGDSTIWLCGQFWAAPATGKNSKAGTIVHEHSHSDGYTDDHIYGEEDCLDLAVRIPYQAVDNADNFEYYVED